jgi:methyl-accepting chemotaxis protein
MSSCIVLYKVIGLVEAATASFQATEQLVRRADAVIDQSRQRIDAITLSLQSTAQASEQTADAARQVANAQLVILNDKQVMRSLRLALGSGDNFARSMMRIEALTGKLESETLPEVNRLLGAGTLAMSKLTSRLGSPEIDRALVSLEHTAASLEVIAAQTEASSAEVQAAIPELRADLKRLSDASAGSAEEVQKFLKGLNAPKTKKQKIFEALIKAALVVAPYTQLLR